MRRLGFCALALFIGVPILVRAEPLRIDRMLTLQEAVDRVRNVGFDVRVARGDAQAAAGDAGIAAAALRPQLGVSGVAISANEPQLGMPIARQTYGAASLSLPILSLQAGAMARAAGATARAALGTVNEAANDAAFLAAQAYRRVQLAAAVLEARHVAVADQQDHARLTEARVAAGKLARFALLRDRAALALALQGEEDAASERDQARNDFAALLDLDLGSQVVFEALSPAPFDESSEAVLTRAVAQRPSFMAANQRLQAAEESVKAAHGAYAPNVALSAQSYNGSSSPPLGRSGGQVQLTATIPLVDGGSRSGALGKAEGEVTQAAAMRDKIFLSLKRDVANALRELAAARRNLMTAQAALTDAQEQLRIARLREVAGKGIELEVLDALSVTQNARETVVRSLTRYDNAVAAVHHAAGDRSM